LADVFGNHSAGLTSPLIGALGAITPHDVTLLSQVTREIYVAGAGNVSVLWADGTTTVEPVGAGERRPWRVQRVNSTSTTATGIRGFY